jgi:hypothetical protein
MAATAAAPDHVRFDAADTLRWYAPVDDPTVHYGFCGVCGSSLFWRADAHPEKLSICAGPLDGPTGLVTTQAWWVGDAGDYFARPLGVVEYERE